MTITVIFEGWENGLRQTHVLSCQSVEVKEIGGGKFELLVDNTDTYRVDKTGWDACEIRYGEIRRVYDSQSGIANIFRNGVPYG